MPGSEVEQLLELEHVIETVHEAEIAVGVEAGYGAEVACKPEVDAGQSHVVYELAIAVAGIVELSAVDMGSTADIAVDKDHIQDTAGSIVDTVVVADTTVLKLPQQTELKLVLENLGLLAD